MPSSGLPFMTMAGQMNTLKGRDNPTDEVKPGVAGFGSIRRRFSVEAFAGDHVSYAASGSSMFPVLRGIR